MMERTYTGQKIHTLSDSSTSALLKNLIAFLNDVLQDFCSIIKYVRKSSLRCRMFQGTQVRMLCDEDQARAEEVNLKLIYYSESGTLWFFRKLEVGFRRRWQLFTNA